MGTDTSALRRLQPTFWLSLILLLGFSLRLIELGHDSLWNDEVGVALAARAGSFSEMLRAAHNHVMAMPLDYAIVWLFARLNTSETFLRLPAAIWGSLSIVVAYGFFSRLSGRRVGLLSALLLALSPFHVQYSQELRFYASLVFFFLAASWALFKAIDEPSPAHWLIFTLVAVLGLFFHIYVLLVLVSGVVWLAIGAWNDGQTPARRMGFLRASAALLVAFLIGVVYFGAVYSYDIPLVLEDPSLLAVIATGLGWTPFYPSSTGISLAWGLACLVLEIVGIGLFLIRRPRSAASAMFYGLLLQIGAIVAMNALKHYFIAPRQMIPFLPVLLFFAAYALDRLITRVESALRAPRSSGLHAELSILPTAVAILLISALSLPALRDYYRGDKGEAREIGEFLLKNAHPADTILVIPDFESQMIDYYLDDLSGSQASAYQVYGAAWDQLSSLKSGPGKRFLVSNQTLPHQESQLAESLGYRPAFQPAGESRYARTVWVQENR
ncbi:MAG TPA: glycosyltransferase family 39 protein [Anaerolineaceae bacterium]|nr:glycosyltransferase family 39 protein [Anaerolineaceae bacterium]